MSKQTRYLVIKPYPIIKYEIINITYKGKLTKFKKNKLYVYYGYGNAPIWHNVDQQEMKNSSKGYSAAIKIYGSELLNICFHDNQGHWDNNNGENWCFEIMF